MNTKSTHIVKLTQSTFKYSEISDYRTFSVTKNVVLFEDFLST